MSALQIIIVYAASTVLLFTALWVIFGGRRSDAELHHAADQARRQRQRDAWTSPDGKTVR